jgi:hypothetical protein
MDAGHKGEEKGSVDLVRILIRSFVSKAVEGKLKKFNKPNPTFGDTLDDIKLLVREEFGWDNTDISTYEELLKNWNNDRPIGEPEKPPPLQVSTSISLGSTTASDDAKDDNRDYQGELDELLKVNPNPDWKSLGLTLDPDDGWILMNEDSGAFSIADARIKVLLLKGEATASELK